MELQKVSGELDKNKVWDSAAKFETSVLQRAQDKVCHLLFANKANLF